MLLLELYHETYLWYFRDDSLEFEPHRIVVQHLASRGQMLIIAPVSRTYTLAFEIRPHTIREIILFGTAHGWTTTKKAQPFLLAHDGQRFVKK